MYNGRVDYKLKRIIFLICSTTIYKKIYTYIIQYSLDETLGDYYYFNFETGETQWSHPLDKIYCQRVIDARKNLHKDKLGSTFCTDQINDSQTFADTSVIKEEKEKSHKKGEDRNSEIIQSVETQKEEFNNRSNSTEEVMDLGAPKKLVNIIYSTIHFTF